MKITLNRNFIIPVLAIILISCNSHEEVSVDQTTENWEPTEIDMNDDEFLLAKYISEDSEITMNFLEPLEGKILVTLQFEPEVNMERIKPYNDLLNKMYKGEFTLDELYVQLYGSSTDKEVVDKLKKAQHRVEKQKQNNVEPISLKDGRTMQKKAIEYFDEKYGNTSNSKENESEKLNCDSVPGADWFAQEICNGNSQLNADLPPGANLTHCYSRSWPGYSLDPAAYATYYRVWSYNAFISGTNRLNVLISIDHSPFIFPLYPNQITMFHWYMAPSYAYSYVSNKHPDCPVVSHAVFEIN